MLVTTEELAQAEDGQIDFEFEEQPEGINLVSPAKVRLSVKRTGGGFINVSGNVSAEIKAVCDNCLKDFIYKIDTDIDENFAENTLYDEYSEETEIKDGFFAVDLNGSEKIDLSDLIYQTLILSVPNKFVCDINCIGGNLSKYIKNELPDPRLEVFKTIKTEKE